MSKRLRKMLKRVREPMRGDEIFVRDENGDDWVNGMVNAVADGKLLVATAGHSRAYLVAVPINGHRKHWCWPSDIVPASRRRLTDEEHASVLDAIRRDHLTEPQP